MNIATRLFALCAAAALLGACTASVPPMPGRELADAPVCSIPGMRYGGLQDGAAGFSAAEAEKHARSRLFDCGIDPVPDELVDSWLAGRAEGVAYYCSRENAEHLGVTGQTPRMTCPKAMRTEFAEGYALGASRRNAAGSAHRRIYDPYPWGIHPHVGIGIGSGGVSTGIGVGISL